MHVYLRLKIAVKWDTGYPFQKKTAVDLKNIDIFRVIIAGDLKKNACFRVIAAVDLKITVPSFNLKGTT